MLYQFQKAKTYVYNTNLLINMFVNKKKFLYKFNTWSLYFLGFFKDPMLRKGSDVARRIYLQ